MENYKVGDLIEVLIPHSYIQWDDKYPLKEGQSWISGKIIEIDGNAIIYELPDIHVDRMMSFKNDLGGIRLKNEG